MTSFTDFTAAILAFASPQRSPACVCSRRCCACESGVARDGDMVRRATKAAPWPSEYKSHYEAFGGRWLGAGSVHSEDHDIGKIMYSIHSLCYAYPQLDVVVNHYDNPRPKKATRGRNPTRPTPLAGQQRILTTWIPGFKGLFWKLALTPEFVSRFTVVWMFDSDIAVHPSVLPLGTMTASLFATGASVVQPSIRALVHGTYHSFLRVRAAHMSCLAHTARFVELQTPVFRTDAWVAFQSKVMSLIPDEDLAQSDYGIDISWCAFLASEFPSRPPCLVLPATSALHSNTHRIERFMNATAARTVRSCAGVCRVIQKHFLGFMQNFSHDTRDCWAASPAGLQWEGGKFSLDGSLVTARRTRSGAHSNVSLETEEDEADPHRQARYLGLVSIHSKDNRLTTMLLSLKAVVDSVPTLRIFINYFDNDNPADSADRGQKPNVHADNRFFYSKVPGNRIKFWVSKIDVAMLEHIIAVWIFDPYIALYPANYPLMTFFSIRGAIQAEVLQLTVRGTEAAAFSDEQFALVDPPSGSNPSCAATTLSAVRWESVLIAKDTFKALLKKFKHREYPPDDAALGKAVCHVAEKGLEDRRLDTFKRPACAILREPRVQLLDDTLETGRRRVRRDAPGGYKDPCLKEGCPGSFTANETSAVFDDGRCYGFGIKGWNFKGFRTHELGQRRKHYDASRTNEINLKREEKMAKFRKRMSRVSGRGRGRGGQVDAQRRR